MFFDRKTLLSIRELGARKNKANEKGSRASTDDTDLGSLWQHVEFEVFPEFGQDEPVFDIGVSTSFSERHVFRGSYSPAPDAKDENTQVAGRRMRGSLLPVSMG